MKKNLPPLTDWQKALVAENDGLVIHVAKQYFPGKIPDDVISDGNIGLCFAAQRFDRSRGLQFNTYAVYWVRAKILEHIIQNHGPVRFGTTRAQRKAFFGFGKARAAVDPDSPDLLQEIAQHLDLDRETIEMMSARLANTDVFLDAPRSPSDKRSSELVDDGGDPEEKFASIEYAAREKQTLNAALERLDKRDLQIIQRRFLREKPHTLRQIGKLLRLSRERVRQLELRALQHLRMLLSEDVAGLKALKRRRKRASNQRVAHRA